MTYSSEQEIRSCPITEIVTQEQRIAFRNGKCGGAASNTLHINGRSEHYFDCSIVDVLVPTIDASKGVIEYILNTARNRLRTRRILILFDIM